MFDVPPSQPSLPTADSKSSVPLHNANLLRSSQFPHDGPLPGSQLPTDLDGSSHNNPSDKDKEAISTFSWAVMLGMGSLSGGSVPRTRTECHVYPTSSNLEPTHKVKGQVDYVDTAIDGFYLSSLMCMIGNLFGLIGLGL